MNINEIYYNGGTNLKASNANEQKALANLKHINYFSKRVNDLVNAFNGKDVRSIVKLLLLDNDVIILYDGDKIAIPIPKGSRSFVYKDKRYSYDFDNKTIRDKLGTVNIRHSYIKTEDYLQDIRHNYKAYLSALLAYETNNIQMKPTYILKPHIKPNGEAQVLIEHVALNGEKQDGLALGTINNLLGDLEILQPKDNPNFEKMLKTTENTVRWSIGEFDSNTSNQIIKQFTNRFNDIVESIRDVLQEALEEDIEISVKADFISIDVLIKLYTNGLISLPTALNNIRNAGFSIADNENDLINATLTGRF